MALRRTGQAAAYAAYWIGGVSSSPDARSYWIGDKPGLRRRHRHQQLSD
ncbi:hypothetical protein RM550_07260 [Streptomyces sp. DSM 41527]|uniref:Uncharacterized protein n=1 Tax=Streptomyces mooreae TaxID=3075523 RepID=A0ABU2T2U0_9ACTN|nr:hypothetical protein [Streptomyces sp. DSM 41527]MDT0455537.1 hypothetical protein [Streptomyces sp. DSM 41527]